MKKCPFCAEDIQDAAIVCKHCGRDIGPPGRGSDGGPAAPPAAQPAGPAPPSPGVAAVLSLVIPGAGHMYAGRIGLGFVFLVAVAAGYTLLLIPGALLHVVAVVAAYSAAQQASKPTATKTEPVLSGWHVLLGAAAVMVVLWIMMN